jgi:hypothetical protein
MSNHRKHGSWIASAVLACFAANSVQASELSCVQRAIDWNQASTNNYVVVSLVSLHETGQGSYTSGILHSQFQSVEESRLVPDSV